MRLSADRQLKFLDKSGFAGREQMLGLVGQFHDTRNISLIEFGADTAKMLNVSKTHCLTNAVELTDIGRKQEVEFICKGTVKTAYDAKDKYDRVAMLNFADALTPGGLVESGAVTQEENICRCTNLYESLLANPDYYNANRLSESWKSGVYTDYMIYSVGVKIFKDDLTYERVIPKDVDVITSPSPLGNSLSYAEMGAVLKVRIRKFLKLAQLHGVKAIVLGAWGCGAFGQDIDLMATCFAEVLSEVNAFDKVIFAIRGNESAESKSSTLEQFKKYFNKAYTR